MASLYWVGGTAAWDGTAGTKWALTSGGVGGLPIPTSSDNVFLDANSGAVSVSIATGNTGCLSLDCTGFTGSLLRTSGALTISGSFTAGSGMSSLSPGVLTFNSTTSGNTLTFNGINIAGGSNGIIFNGVGGVWTFQDNVSVIGNQSITLTNGSIFFNGKTVSSVGGFSSSNSNVRTWDMTSSTLTTIAGGTWNFSTVTNLTLVTTGSTINMGSSGTPAFIGGGKIYNKVIITGSGTLTIVGSNTFTTFSVGPSVTHAFTAGTTQTVTNFVSTGSYGKLATIKSTSNGSTWTISVASGQVNCNWISVQDCIASGGATFTAYSSTNTSNNSGWTFLPAPWFNNFF